MTQQGFLRLATDPRVVQEEAVSLCEAWAMYDALMGDHRVRFSEEPAGLEPMWRSYTQHRTKSPKVWNDAFLAAFARAAALTLVTFDQGFAQYPDVNCTLLSQH